MADLRVATISLTVETQMGNASIEVESLNADTVQISAVGSGLDADVESLSEPALSTLARGADITVESLASDTVAVEGVNT